MSVGRCSVLCSAQLFGRSESHDGRAAAASALQAMTTSLDGIVECSCALDQHAEATSIDDDEVTESRSSASSVHIESAESMDA
tara:strand:+ start:249 stop:497 length:249 start_codon:yes stop_codon:yes gene_type:complete